MTLPYCKGSGAGNTFILIDHRKKSFSKPQPEILAKQASNICFYHEVDGLIFLENSLMADFRMRIFNRDGSEAEMCGNGLRCCIKLLEKLGESKERWQIETGAGLHFAWIKEEEVCVQMPSPKAIRWNFEVTIGQENYLLHHLVVGVPHAIHFVDEIEKVEIIPLGEQIRYHPIFAPQGTNVTFVSRCGEQSIAIRTYERGIENETSACGTGAAAAAVAAAKLYTIPSEVTVSVRSGEKLKVYFTSNWEQITLQGKALIQLPERNMEIKQAYFSELV